MYIKLTFRFVPWVLPQTASGLNAMLTKQPEIVVELPQGAEANVHSEKLRTLMTKDLVQAGYYHDCKELSLMEVQRALDQFAAHYHNYSDGKLPGSKLSGLDPKNNEIINNLEIALENVRNNTENAFFSVLSADDGEEQYSREFF